MTSIPVSSSRRAMWSFSPAGTSSACMPSRSVVSRTRTLSLIGRRPSETVLDSRRRDDVRPRAILSDRDDRAGEAYQVADDVHLESDREIHEVEPVQRGRELGPVADG